MKIIAIITKPDLHYIVSRTGKNSMISMAQSMTTTQPVMIQTVKSIKTTTFIESDTTKSIGTQKRIMNTTANHLASEPGSH